jgi:4-alpha-glucanotransferase
MTGEPPTPSRTDLETPVRKALAALGIRNLLLGIHDAAFPSRPDEDIGRGTPYSRGGADFLEFAAQLGFSGVQLGPQGIASPGDLSPYDSSMFSKSPRSIALAPLASEEWRELLSQKLLAEAVAARPGRADRVAVEHAFAVQRCALAEVEAAFRRRAAAGDPSLRSLSEGFASFRRANADWLERDALYDVLEREHGGVHWSEWRADERDSPPDQRLWDPEPDQHEAAERRRAALGVAHGAEIDAFAFAQYLIHEQHRGLRALCAGLPLALFGDLQIGLSARDSWFARGFLLPGYVMGAPPSRTNPEGQAWNYGVLDPERYFDAAGGPGAGPALRFLRARVDKLFAEFDGLRIDHPHGLVCPWVYRAGTSDPARAVRDGARLHASPDLPDHEQLTRYAIARPDQLDRSRPRHDDGWVRGLGEEQVDRYGTLVAAIVEAARRRGHGVADIACEVLSTQPYPLGRVIARHGFGRFRVTQKADLERKDDVYRGENAKPEDWIETAGRLPRVAAAAAGGGPRGLDRAHCRRRRQPRPGAFRGSVRRPRAKRPGVLHRPPGVARGLQPPGHGEP